MKPLISTNQETNDAKELLGRIADFAMQPGQPCFSGWRRNVVRHYLEFHVEWGTLAWHRTESGNIDGVAVAWQLHRKEMANPEFLKRPFYWQATDPTGDAIMIAHIVCRGPDALAAMMAEYVNRWPRWRELGLYAIRRGRLVEYNPEPFLSRLIEVSRRNAMKGEEAYV